MMEVDLDQITKEFGEAYRASKDWSQTQSERQKRFFDACTQILEDKLRSQQIVSGPGSNQDPITWVPVHYPGWRYVDNDTEGRVLIEEDPAFIKYEHINREDGYIYTRTTMQEAPQLDDNALREEDLDLWKEISFWPEPWYTLVRDAIASFSPNLQRRAVEQFVDTYFERKDVPRTLSDPSSWTDEQAEKVSKYLRPGKLTVRLVPPRKAKPEELGDE